MNIWNDIDTEKFWKMASLGHEYLWACKGVAKTNLISILKGYNINSDELFCSDETTHDANIRLHHGVSSILEKLEGKGKYELFLWIIEDWGGIRRGNPQTVTSWLKSFPSFEEKEISNFIKAQGNTRISSWSKILSFISPEKYAIYDSRTAFSANFVLNKMGDKRRFFTPPGRNRHIAPMLGGLARDDGNYIGYLEYLELLKTFPSSKNILIEAEMILFSNAPYLARKL